jgi:hypothetical protein
MILLSCHVRKRHLKTPMEPQNKVWNFESPNLRGAQAQSRLETSQPLQHQNGQPKTA